METRALPRTFVALLRAALLACLGVSALPATAATPTFDANCTSCHVSPPEGARINAAGAAAVITAANTAHGMALNAGQIAAIPAIATELDGFFSRLEPTATVAYHSSGNSITMTKLVIDASPPPVITSTSISSAPSRGTATGGTPNSLVVSYSHTANNCLADSFQVVGTGLATTAPRTVPVSITPPAAPIANPSTSTIAYSTGATAIPLTLTGGPALSIVIDSQPSVGSVSPNGLDATYTASSTSYAAQVTFTYHVVGPCANSGSAMVTVNVGTPPAPTVSSKNQTVQSNTTTNISLTANITGIYTAPIAIATPPANGNAVVVGTTVNYTPNPNYSGADSFTYTATGPGGTSLPASVNLTVTAAPLTADRNVTVSYQTATPIDLTSSITGAFLSVAVGTPPAHGTAIATGPSTITYTPAAGYSGPDTFTYTATGAGGTSTPANVNITVNPPAPTAGPTSVTVPASTTTAINLSGSITGTFTSVAVATPPAHGNAVGGAGGTINYTPTLNYIGGDSFTYTATGPGGTSAPATVTITVQPPPPPGATAASFDIPYNTTTNINLYASLSGVFTSITLVTNPSHGTATISNGTLVTYTPTAGYYGPDTFTYVALGLGGASSVQTVTLNVLPPAAPTVAARTAAVPFNTPITIDLASAVSGVFTSIAVATQPAHGTATMSGTVVTYKPANNYTGPDSFTFTATGPGGTSSPGTVTLEISTAPPVAASTTMAVAFNGSGTIDLAPLIYGSGVTGISIASQPTHGTAAVNGTKVTYTPAPEFFGNDKFTYIAYGNAGTSPPATITVTIVGRPDPSKNAVVGGIIEAQDATAQRFARAQIGNIQQRLESLHSRAPAPEAAASAQRPAAQAPRAAREDPIHVASAGGAVMADVIPSSTTSTLASALANSLMSLAASQSLSVSPASASLGNGNGVELWAAGTLRFGNFDSNGPMRFTTDGVSVGVDKRLSDRLALGMGVGFARDKTDIGNDGSKTRTDGTSFAAYATYSPSRTTFVDGLVGYASMDIDSDRFVGMMGEFARSQRKGEQWFGSLSAGYEHRIDGMLVSPYGRLDYASTRLKQATESGGGAGALVYFEQTVPMFQGVLGLRAESQHDTRFGAIRPRARAEYSHDFEGDRTATVAYADQFGTRYTVTPAGVKRNALLLGVGSDFLFGAGLKVGLDYQVRGTSRGDIDQGIRLQLTQALDGKGGRMMQWFGSSIVSDDPIRVDAGYTYDDNVTRSREARDKLADHIFSFGASKGRIFPLAANSRVTGSIFVNADELYRYTGLGRFSGGAQAELQYRTSGDWSATTFGLQGRVTGDYYDSEIRRGYRYSVALTARQSLTDRLEAFAAITANVREGKSSVFDLKDYGAKVNLDYALGGSNGSVYAAGEYRRGDTTSSGRYSLVSLDTAEVFTPDDAFGPGFFAYRFEATTWLGTLGYNRPLGARDAIDISWRRAQSTPTERPAFPVQGPMRYIDNQYSIIYLLRF